MTPVERLILENQLMIMVTLFHSTKFVPAHIRPELQEQIHMTRKELKMHESDVVEFPEGFVIG